MNLNENESIFMIGPDEPKDTTVPWLKDGKEWWLFNENKKRYFPIEIHEL